MTANPIEVDLTNRESLVSVLERLSGEFKESAALAAANDGIEFGITGDSGFSEHKATAHEEIPSYSEFAFFQAASADSSLQSGVVAYIDKVITANKKEGPLWYDQEMPLGLNAAFALALCAKEYTAKYVELLRTCDMDHEVYQPFQIMVLLEKWLPEEAGLFLLAARSCSIAGQFGIEEYELPVLSAEEKALYFRYLMQDAFEAKAVFSDLLADALTFLDIKFDPVKLAALFENHRPVYSASALPNLRALQ